MDINAYIKTLQESRDHGGVGEHSHRMALQSLLESAMPKAKIINEPSRLECGAPDFVLTRNQIPFGYIETKDIGENLDNKANKEQLKRYTDSLSNVLYTDYLEFRRFRDGKEVQAVVIGTIVNGKIKPKPENFADFDDMLETFARYEGQTITSADDLAKRMASKARMLATEIENALDQDKNSAGEISAADNALTGQLATFKKYLIHDLKPGDFADIYAQTVAYGMFAARLHDSTLPTFSRKKAAKLIPTTNPFLRKFFQHIAGYELDERIHWIVDDLADLFRAADVGELMEDYRKDTKHNDPFLHFYETFLGEYNPTLRKSRGVYYTPEPVVNFIVRAVDEILCTEFGLSEGLADTGKTTIEVAVPDKTGKKTVKREMEVHKVQILDPATGTGTFLAAIVQEIYAKYFANQKGIWSEYVKRNLIPRLSGFEVLMASYAMAHIKLEMVLRDSGCKLGDDRLRIFLTNSLEEHDIDAGAMFAEWLSAEANEANFIKRDAPVMVVVGNPPYSGESANKGEWIGQLLKVYKREPIGGPLQEKNSKWINDDYVKFIRYGQYHIDKTGEGILAYISNHGFLDNQTFRGMRWNLLQSFDKIYIIDLHGNLNKNETAPDGSPDKNIFEIQQGVSINLFIKTGKKKKDAPGRVFHHDVYGERESKYQFLRDNELGQIDFQELETRLHQYYFVPKDYKLQNEYEEGFSLKDLFRNTSVGIVTARDKFTIYYSPQELKTAIAKFRTLSDEVAREQFLLKKDARDWKVALARTDLEDNVFGNGNDEVVAIQYRPFDIRYTYYTGKSKGFHCMPRGEVMRHFIQDENVGLNFQRGSGGEKFLTTPQFSKNIYDQGFCYPSTNATTNGAPLYLYEGNTRTPNLNMDIVKIIESRIKLNYTEEKITAPKTFSPIDIVDYIYAVLHSHNYRCRYEEFLKIDFPYTPYPADSKSFRELAKLGAELRALHLMESPALNKLITGYPEAGDNIVTKPKYKTTNVKTRVGKVQINDKQYFENVPETAWNFPIGGYQPAQKWLKDRKGRKLTSDDIIHYQKIIVVLTETARLMEKIDEVDFMKKS